MRIGARGKHQISVSGTSAEVTAAHREVAETIVSVTGPKRSGRSYTETLTFSGRSDRDTALRILRGQTIIKRR